MRRNARRRRSKTRSIQRSVQIFLTVTGIVFLLAGLVLAASGTSVSSAVGSVSDRWDDSRQPTEDDGGTSAGDTTGTNGRNETDGSGSDPDRTEETGTGGGEQTARNENESAPVDESHALTAIVENETGEPVGDATVTVEGGNGTGRAKPVGGNGEAEFELEDGQYTVTADADGYRTTETTTRIDGANETITLTLEDRDSTDNATGDDGPYTLAVTVENETGDPIDNATVELKADALLASSEEKTVGDDGRAEFERDDGEYTITADADGYEARTRSVEIDGSDRAITLTLAATDD